MTVNPLSDIEVSIGVYGNNVSSDSMTEQEDPDPDDEELETTDPGVVIALGFDPKELSSTSG